MKVEKAFDTAYAARTLTPEQIQQNYNTANDFLKNEDDIAWCYPIADGKACILDAVWVTSDGHLFGVPKEDEYPILCLDTAKIYQCAVTLPDNVEFTPEQEKSETFADYRDAYEVYVREFNGGIDQ